MAIIRVKVLSKPFRDKENGLNRRKPGQVFQCSKERAEFLVKNKWVEYMNPADAKAKEPKRDTKENKEVKTEETK